jgi:hypothetical protein
MPRIAFFLVNKPGICASHTSGFVSSMHVAAWIMQQLWHYELRYIYIIIYIYGLVCIYTLQIETLENCRVYKNNLGLPVIGNNNLV